MLGGWIFAILVEIIVGVFVKQTKGLWIYCGLAEFLPLLFYFILIFGYHTLLKG